MTVYKGRGRPARVKEADEATPQLRARHRRGLTLTPLEWLLRKGELTQEEHWAGVRLRQLHVGVYGGVASQSGFYWLDRVGGNLLSDEQMRRRRQEYDAARRHLEQRQLWHSCIALVLEDAQGAMRVEAITGGIAGCSELVSLWCKSKI